MPFPLLAKRSFKGVEFRDSPDLQQNSPASIAIPQALCRSIEADRSESIRMTAILPIMLNTFQCMPAIGDISDTHASR
ncbi:hypothetical protein DXT94_15160 [Rhizobium sp. ICMP 5592]|nr:hypothetical protein [Rhizobium sp. ICMP 5592]